jgi:hypothetical protein
MTTVFERDPNSTELLRQFAKSCIILNADAEPMPLWCIRQSWQTWIMRRYTRADSVESERKAVLKLSGRTGEQICLALSSAVPAIKFDPSIDCRYVYGIHKLRV